MRIENTTRKSIIASNVRIADTAISRMAGLMFSKPTPNGLMLSWNEELSIGLHMMFVFYPIDVFFIDKKGKIADIKENFRPFTMYTCKRKAAYAIEMLAGTAQKSKSRIGDTVVFLK